MLASGRPDETLEREVLLAMAAGSKHAGSPWFQQWLDDLDRDGTLTRIAREARPFPDVIAVLDALPAAGIPLATLADLTLGNPSALTHRPDPRPAPASPRHLARPTHP